jgi:hypothetical protein
MRRGEGLEAAIVVFYVVQPLFIAVVAVVNGFADGVEPRVIFYERKHSIVLFISAKITNYLQILRKSKH